MNFRIIGAAIFLLASCVEADCTLELGIAVQPQPVNLVVGQSATPDIRVTTCSGRKEVHVTDWRWESSDTAVARVDSISGRITGVAVGQTTVVSRSRLQGLLAGVVVIVR